MIWAYHKEGGIVSSKHSNENKCRENTEKGTQENGFLDAVENMRAASVYLDYNIRCGGLDQVE